MALGHPLSVDLTALLLVLFFLGGEEEEEQAEAEERPFDAFAGGYPVPPMPHQAAQARSQSPTVASSTASEGSA